MQAIEREIERLISAATGSPFRIAGSRSIGGGCIHDARGLTGKDGRRFFIKQNAAAHLPAFEAEAASLRAMAATRTIRVPAPIGTWETAGRALLILEYLPIGNPVVRDWARMGAQLARMHQSTADTFGWDHDNWIGSSPQINTRDADWIAFTANCRLLPQIGWARRRGLKLGQADQLVNRLPDFFRDYSPLPSLLHGDLWAGNAGFLEDGTPVVFDPASYYGDREADLAMTELFGGFPESFYDGYESVWPLDPGYAVRKDLTILYHVINHFNLFGGGYGAQADGLIRRLLAAI
jgi:fructosamine-3-kinase